MLALLQGVSLLLLAKPRPGQTPQLQQLNPTVRYRVANALDPTTQVTLTLTLPNPRPTLTLTLTLASTLTLTLTLTLGAVLYGRPRTGIFRG